MYWLSFIVVAYVAAVLQTTVAPEIRFGGHTPDFLLIVAVHYALTAPAEQSPVSCWILGLLADVVRLTLGVHAFAYGLLGTTVLRVRTMIFRDQVVPHAVLVVVACCLIQALAGGVEMVKTHNVRVSVLVELITDSFFSAVYSAVLTLLPLHWILKWSNSLLGIRPAHAR